MFSATHILWLAISIAVAVFFFLWAKKQPEKKVLGFMCGLSVASEVVKLFCSVEPTATGMRIDAEVLPFHLCSIQIFIVFVLYLSTNERIREFLYAFSYPAAVVGAFCALVIPTEGTAFNKLHPYQYFLYHAFLIGYGIWIYHTRRETFGKKSFFQCLLGLLCCAWFNFYMNALTGENFMFLAEPPLPGLPFLNADHGWYVYFAHLMCTAAVGLCLPYILVFLKKRKKTRETAEVR